MRTPFPSRPTWRPSAVPTSPHSPRFHSHSDGRLSFARCTLGSRPGALVQTPSALWLAWRARGLEGVPVLRDIGLPLRWRVFLREDRRHRALGLARAAVDALVGMDVELVLALVDAVHRTNVHAGSVFDVDAGFRDDVRHPDGSRRCSATGGVSHRQTWISAHEGQGAGCAPTSL